MMNVYFVEREDRFDYDSYDSFVCICEDDQTAKFMHPRDGWDLREERTSYEYSHPWVSPSDIERLVTVTFIGSSSETESRIVCSSFNAG